LDIQIDQQHGFPVLLSGSITLRNSIPPHKELTVACADLEEIAKFGAPYILMDTGAGGTLLPLKLAEALDIDEPPAEEDHWILVHGIGGVTVGFRPITPITISLTDKRGDVVSTDIYPTIQTCWAPSFSAIRDHMETWKGRTSWPKAISNSVAVPFSIDPEGFTASVQAPVDDCPILCRRPRLQAAAQRDEFLSPILIGRDWQTKHRLLFRDRSIRID
jgi:hypothetical protein